MAKAYKSKVSHGAPNRFNPKCNQNAHPEGSGKGILTVAERAAEGMKVHAAYRAEQAAYECAKAAQKTQPTPQPVRWLKYEVTS